MTTLQTTHDHHQTQLDYFDTHHPDDVDEAHTSDPLTHVALDLNSRRHDLADLLIAAHKLDRAALRIAEQLHDLESTLTDLQVDQAFNCPDDADY